MKRNKKLSQFVSFGLVIGAMLIIFAFSAQPATVSKQVSNHFISSYQKVIKHIPFIPKPVRTRLLRGAGHYVRKVAHLMIYALLGILSLIALWQLPVSKRKAWYLALLVCVLYAMIDEWHQYYIQGRGAQWSDVLLDSLGSFIGIGAACLLRQIYIGVKKCFSKK